MIDECQYAFCKFFLRTLKDIMSLNLKWIISMSDYKALDDIINTLF